MKHTTEFAKAIALAEQARNKKSAIVAQILQSINDAEGLIAQLGEQGQMEAKRTIDILEENADLKQRNAALNKELMEQTSRANRLEAELHNQVMKNQEEMQYYHLTFNYDKIGYMAAEDEAEVAQQPRSQKSQRIKERMIAMSTVLSFGSTRMTQEAVQTVVDLLYFAINDRTPEEDRNIKKLMADFRKTMRPQMDVKDSTQNFYMK